MVLWPFARVPMYPHSWSIHEVALLDVLEANVVEEQGLLVGLGGKIDHT